MYKLVRWCLFLLPPEMAHIFTLKMLGFIPGWCFPKGKGRPVNVMGLAFPNRVGLAAGFDRNGEYVDGLGKLGFGFIEVGTVTLVPQPGYPKPRIFRIPEKEAIINRMGFYNKGMEYFLQRIQKVKYKGILGVDIVKNFSTPLEDSIPEYVKCFQDVYPYAHYVAVNISSPNTPGLRKMQFGEYLENLLQQLKQEQTILKAKHGKYVPIVVKIAPDLTDDQIKDIATTFLNNKVDGVIATNSTTSRKGVEGLAHSEEKGGLSGKPLQQQSTHVIKVLHQALKGQIPIIGVGGIMTAKDAKEKLDAGASLVQVYSGLIYSGPNLVTSIANL